MARTLIVLCLTLLAGADRNVHDVNEHQQNQGETLQTELHELHGDTAVLEMHARSAAGAAAGTSSALAQVEKSKDATTETCCKKPHWSVCLANEHCDGLIQEMGYVSCTCR
mmetsp:Transcript_115824/g.173091  ORF Transcript_115824/g.173091 Transcript_115824/m.173091 type:complete len:111 (+) Transcript_115824:63-395(+)